VWGRARDKPDKSGIFYADGCVALRLPSAGTGSMVFPRGNGIADYCIEGHLFPLPKPQGFGIVIRLIELSNIKGPQVAQMANSDGRT
jgi:hypothetical protein